MKKVSLCRIYENLPETVESVRFSPCGNFIAVSRYFGSIQLIDSRSFYVYTTLPNIFLHGSANSIIWVRKTPHNQKEDLKESKLSFYNLVTTGLHGLIVYWDLEYLIPMFTSQSYGGAIFSSSYNPSQYRLYLACDDSTIRVFSLFKSQLDNTLEPELVLFDTIKHPKGKILSIALYNDLIFSGSSESTIYKHCDNTSTTMNLSIKNNVQVWSLVYIHVDNVLISGDSLGIIRFWDIVHCIEIRSIEQHSADILCMGITNDQKTLFVGGVDMKLTTLGRDLNSDNWNIISVRYPHKGTIKSLDVDRSHRVITGGDDCHVCLSSGLRDLSGLFQVTKILPLPSPTESFIDVSINDSIVLCKNRLAVNLWSLYDHESKSDTPIKLASITLDKAEGDITVASISKSKGENADLNSFFCVGNINGIKLFNVTRREIRKVDTIISGICYFLKFVTDDLLLYSTLDKESRSCNLIKYSLVKGILSTFTTQFPIVLIEILNSNLVSLTDLSGSVLILDWEQWTFIELPEMNPPQIITTVSLYPSLDDKIIAIGSENTFYIYNLKTRLIESFNGQLYNKIPENLLDDLIIISSQSTEESVILQSQGCLMSFTPEITFSINSIQNGKKNIIRNSKRLRFGPPLLYEPKFKIISPISNEITNGNINISDPINNISPKSPWKVVRIKYLIHLINRRSDLLAFQISNLEIDYKRRTKYGTC